MTYAKGTTVAVEKSRAEIERMVQQRGARRIGTITDDGIAQIAFELENRRLRFTITLPSPDEDRFRMTDARRRQRGREQAFAAWEGECRRIWRAIAAVIKAKFIAIGDGVYSFDQAFASDIVLPNGKTMAEWAVPQIEAAYESGSMPPLLAAR